MSQLNISEMVHLLGNSIEVRNNALTIRDRAQLQATIHHLAEVSVLESGARQGSARYLTRLAAQAFGIVPASIHALYLARGQDELPHTFTVPAINLRMLSFDAARAIFRVAKRLDASAFIFEIARSEIGYTDQRPAEYTTNILAAAIAEGYTGPVFLQGDHFQVSAKRFNSAPEAEVQALEDLIIESIDAGFYNIDIDASTMVDITRLSLTEQQALNCQLSAQFTSIIRKHQPAGIEISIGGEIGEVGGHNSTVEELRAYMDGYVTHLNIVSPGAACLSKVSVQTGTSHGGVVLPDGSIAQVAVDFGTLLSLSQVARREYGMGGAVQHGASTLPEDAFGKFVESEAIEVHLATNFQNITYDLLPAALREEMYQYLDQKYASERKPGMTDEQFYYKTRKNAIAPFKAQTWKMDSEIKARITNALESQFQKLFMNLGIQGTRSFVEKIITPVPINPRLKFYLGENSTEDDVTDLAD